MKRLQNKSLRSFLLDMGTERSRKTFDERRRILKTIEAKEMSTRDAVDEEIHHLLSPDPEYLMSESHTGVDVQYQAAGQTSLIDHRIDF